MVFHASWITTHDFIDLKRLSMPQRAGEAAPASAFENYHVYYRRAFDLREVEGRYTVNISADDYYKLTVNGVFIGQGPAPAYPDRYRYNTYDITSALRTGENVIGVHVYYQGLVNRVWNSGDNRQGLIMDMMQDGHFLLGTDASWTYACAAAYQSGGVTGANTIILENIDFRQMQKGWNLPGYDGKGWAHAVVDTHDDHIFAYPEPTPPLDVYKVQPQSVVKIAPGQFFLDFGQEITGQFYGVFQGQAGQQVTILCGEETEGPQQARFEMRCNCTYREILTLSGGTDELLFYDYKAFRYVNIQSELDNIDPGSFAAIVRHHPFDDDYCRLESAEPLLSGIWEICKNGVKYGTQESIIDCPSREKGQYLGDFTVSGPAHLYLTGDTAFYKKTLMDFAASCRICDGMLAVAPGSFHQEIADFSLQFPLQILNYYRYTRDLDTVAQLYPAVHNILTYFAAYRREDGLLSGVCGKWNLVDWPDNLRDGYDADLSDPPPSGICHNVLNAFYIGALEAANKLQSLLGMHGLYDTRELKAAFLSAFYLKDKKLFKDREQSSHCALHSNVLPVFFGFAPAEALDNIRDFILSKGLCCGVQFSYFVLKALARLGAYEKEYRLLINQTEHSWANMLREGATTCFEAWGKDQKWNTSLCHPWASAPIIAMIEDLNGKDFFPAKIRFSTASAQSSTGGGN